MLTAIRARNYRCFAQLELELPPFAVFAGANGTGKSTLLDIPLLLGDLLQRGLLDAFLLPRAEQPARAQAFSELLHQGHGDGFALELTARIPNARVERLLLAAPPRIRG